MFDAMGVRLPPGSEPHSLSGTALPLPPKDWGPLEFLTLRLVLLSLPHRLSYILAVPAQALGPIVLSTPELLLR